MNDKTLDYLMRRMSDKRDSEDSRRGRDSRDREDGTYRHGRGNVDFEGSMDFRDEPRYGRDSRNLYEDERDMLDSRDMRDMRDMEDMRYSRDSRDYRDYHHAPRLSKSDMHRWKRMMENEDGTHGPHYDMSQIMNAAEKAGVRFDDFDEKEFCLAVNMVYSDYCKVAKKYVAPDKELAFFVDLAKAFLEDEDGPEASEKIALYFHCIVDA